MFVEFLKKEYILTRRYVFNSVAGALIIGILFILIYMGIGEVVPDFYSEGGKLSLIVSYISWVLSISAFQTVADSIIEESKNGTIQTLYLSRYPFQLLLLIKAFASVLFDLTLLYLMLLFCSAITGVTLRMDLLPVTVIFMISFLGYWGIGFVVGGLSLLYKKVENISQILTFVFMTVMIMPLEGSRLFFLLPGMAGRFFLSRVVSGQYEIEAAYYAYFIGSNMIYFLTGWLIFKLFLQKAVVRGRIGQI